MTIFTEPATLNITIYNISSALREKAKAEKRRLEYLQNPKKCLFCNNPIPLIPNRTLYSTKIKKFCSHKCSAFFTNSQRNYTPKICKMCKINPIKSRNASYCISCIPLYSLIHRKKSECARRHINHHARQVLIKAKIPLICANCKYDKYVEAAHLKGIGSFSSNIPISIINDILNLIWLCPNCHWEQEHNLLKNIKPQ